MPQVEEAPDMARERRASQRRLNTLLGLLFLALALWMMSPMLTSSYVEAYVARLQSMAILHHRGALAMDDQAYPISTELLYVTRLGMVWLLDGAMLLFHSTSLWVLRGITMASFALLAVSSAVFARRWARVPLWASLAAVVLTPGILSPGFFFADNLISASLTALALAMAGGSVRFWRWFGIGAILAFAMLVRLDAVLAAPAVLAVLWLAVRGGRGVGRAMLRGVAYALPGAAMVFAASQWATGISLLTAYRVGHLFSIINNNPAIYQTGLPKTMALIFFGFFGLIALPLIVLGAWRNWKLRGREWSLVMTLLPIVFYALVIPHANEIRDFCLMGAPFVVLQAGTGLEHLLRLAEGVAGPRRWGAWALLTAFALVFLAPPYLSMRDGPRALTGWLYAPVFWRQWQGRTLGMIGEIRGLVDDVQPGQSVLVISSQFEPDRYLHLRLLQDGFQIQSAGAGGCRSLETFKRDGRTVVDLRTENPYGLIHGEHGGEYVEALQIVDALGCVAPGSFTRAYFFSIGQSGELYWPGLQGPERNIPERFPLPILHRASYGFFGDQRLSPGDLERLDAAAKASLASLAPQQMGSALDDRQFQALVQPKEWVPRQ